MGERTPHKVCIAVLAAVMAYVTAPSAQADGLPCPDGTEPFTEYRLFFGRSRGNVEVVSDAAWRTFLAERGHAAFSGRPDRPGRCGTMA